MEDHKQKVNAKKFVRDFRAGKSRAELMRDYGISGASLDKLVRVLVERKLLDLSEAAATASGNAAGSARPVGKAAIREKDPEFTCPQCGAEVGRRALTCPECGHVLPGEDRWQSIDQEKGLLSRIPRKVIGWGLAVPALVAMLFIIKDVVVPLTGHMADKKIEDVRKARPVNSVVAPARENAAEAVSTEAIEQEVAGLIADGTLSAAGQDYATLTTGAIWEALAQDDRGQVLVRLQEAYRASGMTPIFELVDLLGKPVARVNDASVEFITSEADPDSTPAENRIAPSRQLPQDLATPVGKSVESQSSRPLSSPQGDEP